MLASLRQLSRYRALIASLVVRDLKARYRGSAFGFLWSFINPLLLLLIYTFIFTIVQPPRPGDGGPQPYALFMFCGLLPWTWFASSLIESSTVLITGGNLIRKVLFPAEVLPIVSVFSGFAHFCLGLPILAAFFLYYRVPIAPTDLLWFPVIVTVQLMLMLGLALFVSAVTVHFRDVRDLLSNLMTLWFFATPIVYTLSQVPPRLQRLIELNPFTQLAVAYQDVLFMPGRFTPTARMAEMSVASVIVLFAGYWVFDRLRDTFAEQV